jgi:hypothetical protein
MHRRLASCSRTIATVTKAAKHALRHATKKKSKNSIAFKAASKSFGLAAVNCAASFPTIGSRQPGVCNRAVDDIGHDGDRLHMRVGKTKQ